MGSQMTLAGQLFLLGHSAETHAPFISVPTLSTALAGAVVADLIIAQQACVTEHGLVEVYRPPNTPHYHPPPVTDPIAAEVLALIRGGKPTAPDGNEHGHHHRRYESFPPRELLDLIRLDIYPRTQAALVAAGELTQVRRRVLRIPTGSRYAPTNPDSVSYTRGAVRYAVRGVTEPDLSTMALCALIRAVRLLGTLYLSTYPVEELIRSLTRIVEHLSTFKAPHPGIADIADAVESLAGDIVVAVYR